MPFEVVEKLLPEGWHFVSDHDARELAATPAGAAGKLVCRNSIAARPPGAEAVAESLPALFAFKQRIKSQLRQVPHVEEEEPAVCAWYPSARKVVIWNLSTEARTLTVADGERRIPLRVGPLQAAAAEVAAGGEPKAR